MPPTGGDDDQQVPGQIVLPGLPGAEEAPDVDQASAFTTEGSAPPTHSRVTGAPLPQITEPVSPQLREQMFSFLTGRNGVGAASGDLDAQLISAFGASRRDTSRPDTAAAAKKLGVSQRSVQRWLAGGGVRGDHREKIQRTARQAMTTKRGRARALRDSAKAGGAKRPRGRTGIKLGGRQGVTSDLEVNYRARECTVGITDADVEAMQNIWVNHGEQGAAAFLQSHYDEHYAAGWHIQEVESLEWGNSTIY